MCDNHLEFTCTVKPEWFKVDPETSHGISIPNEDRFLFLYNNFEHLVCELQDDGTYWIEFGFETKWAPPIHLYEMMIEDDNILSFNALYFEPGCQVLGYANKEEWIVDEEAPDRNYSECLDKDITKVEPPQSYKDMEWDSWITYEQYQVDIQAYRDTIPSWDLSALQAIDQEIAEMKEYFS